MGLFFAPLPVDPVGVRVTEGIALAFAAAPEDSDTVAADVMVVPPLPSVNGLFSLPRGGLQDAQ